MSQSQRTLQEFRTPMPPAEVLALAKAYFTRRHGIYATFLEQEGPAHVTFRGQGGEEIALAATPADGATLVTGSTYLFDMQVSRFFSTLPAAESSPVAVDAAPVAEPTA